MTDQELDRLNKAFKHIDEFNEIHRHDEERIEYAARSYAKHHATIKAIESGEYVLVPMDMLNDVAKLAFRTLWIAYTHNDHNFDNVHDEAREAAGKLGIKTIEDANQFIDRMNAVFLAASPNNGETK